METADIISNALDLHYSIDDRLKERMLWSDVGMPASVFLHEWVQATENRSYVSNFGDSSIDTGHRMMEVVDHFKNTNDHILLVTHGGAIVDYLRTTFGDETVASLKKPFLSGYDYEMNNCAVNVVELLSEPKLTLLNYTDHLRKANIKTTH
jgi:broad specificity phosphatase PhoE